MCGIVGRAGSLTVKDEQFFKVLLLLDWFRGQDSTGVAAVTRRGAVSTLKISDDPIMLMNHVDFDSTIVGLVDAIWIGHNRASTIGATTRANAHPFTHGPITGVHNGTLEKDSLEEIRERLPEVYGTDSETIFAHIAKYGVEDTVPRLSGAWALVWYDASDSSLNMIRNDQRPLYTCELKRGSNHLLTWASEHKMIVAASEMTKDEGILVEDEEGYGYFPLPVDTHHKWYLDDLLAGNLKPEKSPLKGKPKQVVTYVHTATNDYKKVEDTFNIVEVTVEEEEGLFGGNISEEVWDRISKYGCSYCGTDVFPDDEGLMIFPAEEIVLCPSCSGESVTTISEDFSTPANEVVCY